MPDILNSKIIILFFISIITQISAQEDINISGKVTDASGKALSEATVKLEKADLSTKTDNNGMFSIVSKGLNNIFHSNSVLSKKLAVSLNHGYLSVYVPEQSDIIVTSYSLHGRVLAEVRKNLYEGTHQIAVPSAETNINLYRIKSENSEIILKGFSIGENWQRAACFDNITSIQTNQTSAFYVFDDTLRIAKSGYINYSMHINKAVMSGIIIKLTARDNSLILPREGNPAIDQYNLYKDFLDKADNILSYQRPSICHTNADSVRENQFDFLES